MKKLNAKKTLLVVSLLIIAFYAVLALVQDYSFPYLQMKFSIDLTCLMGLGALSPVQLEPSFCEDFTTLFMIKDVILFALFPLAVLVFLIQVGVALKHEYSRSK